MTISSARVVIGGRTLVLLLTLLVTPVTYALFDELRRLFVPRRSREAAKAGRARHPRDHGAGGSA